MLILYIPLSLKVSKYQFQLSLKVSKNSSFQNFLWFKTQFSCDTFVQGNTLVTSLHTGTLVCWMGTASNNPLGL